MVSNVMNNNNSNVFSNISFFSGSLCCEMSEAGSHAVQSSNSLYEFEHSIFFLREKVSVMVTSVLLFYTRSGQEVAGRWKPSEVTTLKSWSLKKVASQPSLIEAFGFVGRGAASGRQEGKCLNVSLCMYNIFMSIIANLKLKTKNLKSKM